ncbi:peptidoglycan recognition protein family protein [Streptomonospora litoralis]|uniref:N-acetylmuramoyl-L-alanine amidase n=1 Tax=Streptomonospora litoralis TaxID=2498135 RepID=A0A4P6PZ08_9ACTN|nr:N-acetylmuramoyl-L-alanine amidase [Streptomonospora litoralis]QBI53415.1 N-acetylmuramoyl-L-alanine amidase [Streptomonospora litoralis]
MPAPTHLVWRSDLGWDPYSPADYADPDQGLVIHYDSTDQRLARRGHQACIEYWNWCRDFHVHTRGWDDVGYSWFPCPHGYVLEGRGLFRYQAAQGTTAGNSQYYSATLACGPDDEIPEAQIEAVRELRQWLMEPDTSIAGRVLGHKDFTETSCPGDRAYRLVRAGTFRRPPGSAIPDLGSGGGGGARPRREKEVVEPGQDPPYAFPLKRGHWFGPPSSDDRNHSGYYWPDDRPHIREYQQHLADRGWRISVDGRHGPKTARVVEEFQAQARAEGHTAVGPADGLVGRRTWPWIWRKPVTRYT